MNKSCFYSFVFVGLVTSCVHSAEKRQSFWHKAASLIASPDTVFEELQSEGEFKYNRLIGKRIFLKNKSTSVIADIYFSRAENSTPLVVFSHGNKSFKEAHKVQAERFASWGFNVVNLQFPNRKHWVKNGALLSNFVEKITKKPKWLGHTFDKKRIFIIGHSFGGSAATIAASKQPKIAGLILLDPAVVHSVVLKNMRKVKVPVFLLGADRQRYKAKQRDHFYDGLAGMFMELSISGSTHNDAQYPSMTQIFALGFDPAVSGVYQERFLTAGLVAAFDLTMGKKMNFARKVYQGISKQRNIVKNIKWRNKIINKKYF